MFARDGAQEKRPVIRGSDASARLVEVGVGLPKRAMRSAGRGERPADDTQYLSRPTRIVELTRNLETRGQTR